MLMKRTARFVCVWVDKGLIVGGAGHQVNPKKSISRLSITSHINKMSYEFDDFSKDRRRRRLARKRKEKFKKNKDFTSEDRPKRQRISYRDIEDALDEDEEYDDEIFDL